ncbi:MAG: hydrogenase expression/formation protein HypE [Acidobacteria bacterium]|nr:MAG: hydrogenase expression/formation protein HypE [Acidobacteriota bacterium]
MDTPQPSLVNASCPLPLREHERIVLGHGAGGKLTAQLINDVFLPAFRNPVLERMDDQAVLALPAATTGQGAGRLALTTDSFVITPIFFPGGDIGSLAVHGTVNDLAMGGAKPLWLAAAFILEEGLARTDLARVVHSMAAAAEQAGVTIVTGDTKVVNHGKGDQVFITTTGVGWVPEGVSLGANRAQPGDVVLLSGTIGDHGMAILSLRENLEFETTIASDSAALHTLAAALLAACPPPALRCMRDPTRGGVATSLHEIALRSGVGVQLDESAIPVRESVSSACELLGIDPLYVANEGKLVAIVSSDYASRALATLKQHPLGADACRIGEIIASPKDMVLLQTSVGGTRVLDTHFHEQLPRIC